ncbi:glycine--tRNA ligase subunit beta [Piscinibacter koreensis]|uniref:Glycine--tRNA ligase beta subunit n=1 Tax=Piscinibacter koreensis TaxID=2742824 RepID=A0A7Y6TX05_9BURK|nr:glycine--tRNA ligase subunit beta [Schlegelella koreensis]NUZ06501.1 glycine--tRNA ligase subunit beta [Schlegelella koreensis]
MSATQSLLVELQVEELPPKALKALGEAFATELARGLDERRLLAAGWVATPYASPRRLAVHVTQVLAMSAPRDRVDKLMPASVAFGADGQPTPALRKRLEKAGRAELADQWPGPWAGTDHLTVESDGKTEVCFLHVTTPGEPLADALQAALDAAIARLPVPKQMRYQLADGWTSIDFVRPVHGVIALHDSVVVPVRALGHEAGRTTRGHRFEAARPTIEIRSADSYAGQLRDEGAVIASFAERRAEIVRQLTAAAEVEGLAPVDDAALLDEVTGLVERPHVLVCRFEDDFLAVPPECLVLTMKANQKYFPLLDADGRLTNRFLVVSNIDPADPSRVIEGNERVVRPRLADAKFFFDTDRKKTLASRVEGLGRIVYHNKLGTQLERTERVRAIARRLAGQVADARAADGASFVGRVDRAAQLAKADLLSDMVGEFPELQGIMGRYYALHDGEHPDVAQAIEDHYKPRQAGGELPASGVAEIVALADKVETLTGLFGIGQIPTGDKDPFALRRQAIGVIRILIARADLGLDAVLEAGLSAFGGSVAGRAAELRAFIGERLAGLMADAGYSRAECDAVLSAAPDQLAEVPRRLAAVQAFQKLLEAPALAAANKRVTNILRQSRAAGSEPAAEVDASLLVEPAERALADAVAEVGPVAERLFASGDYTGSLSALAALKVPVDAFFDAVMVNADDARLRANRIALLGRLAAAMNRVADLSKLAG